MLKRIITVITAVLLAASFTACKGGNAANNSGSGNMKGKAYAQQSFDGASPQNGMNPAVNSAGELVTASQPAGQPAVVTTWDANGKQKGSVTTDVTDQVSLLALGPKDEVCLLATPQDGNPTVHILDGSGKTIKTIELTGLQPQGMMQSSGGKSSAGGNATPARGPRAMVIGVQATPDGGVIVSALGVGVVQFDASGKQVRTYGQGGMISNITMNEKNQLIVYSISGGTPSVVTFDTSSGNQISSLEVPTMSGVQSLFYDKTGKRLLYMTDSDVQALSADGKTGTPLATFADYSLIDGMRQLMGFAMDKSGAIYLTASNSPNEDNPDANPGGNNASGPDSDQGAKPGSGPSISMNGKGIPMGGGVNEMIRLGLVDASTIPAKKTITVAAINSSPVLDMIISAFQKAYPDYKVNLKVYNTTAVGMQKIVGPGMRVISKQDGAGSQDLTSYIQALNTDIMSGNGPDVIVLDNLPWYKYVDKGLLMDLGQLMADKKLDLSQYYSNIFDGCKINGKLYGAPSSFTYRLLSGKAAYMPDSMNPTLSEFIAKAKTLPQGISPFGNRDAAQIFEQYIQADYPELVDTTTHKAHFDSPEFIQAMKDFRDLIGVNTSTDNNQDPQKEQLAGNVAYNAADMKNPMDLATQRAILGDDMKTTNLPTLTGGKENLFSASLMLGISANSKDRDAAWNFIQTMLGADVQASQSNQMDGYPVLKTAAQKMIEDMKTGSKLGNMRSVLRMGDKEIEVKPLNDEDYQTILNSLPTLDKLQNPDFNVMKILNEELPTFFSGQKTAEDVAGLIQNRVNTLLNE